MFSSDSHDCWVFLVMKSVLERGSRRLRSGFLRDREFGRAFLLLVLVSHFTGALLPPLVFLGVFRPFLGQTCFGFPTQFWIQKIILVFGGLLRGWIGEE